MTRKRICYRCAKGWGHNVGGLDSILRHKPVPRKSPRGPSSKAPTP